MVAHHTALSLQHLDQSSRSPNHLPFLLPLPTSHLAPGP